MNNGCDERKTYFSKKTVSKIIKPTKKKTVIIKQNIKLKLVPN